MSLKNKTGLSFDSLSIAETFKKYYSSLAENLVLKPLKPPNNFGIQSINSRYRKYNLKKKLQLQKLNRSSYAKFQKMLMKVRPQVSMIFPASL